MKHTIKRMLHNWRHHPGQILSYIGLMSCVDALTPKGSDMTPVEWLLYIAVFVLYCVNGLSNYNEGLADGMAIMEKMQ